MATKKKALKKSKLRHAEYYVFQKIQDKLYAESMDGKMFTKLVEIITLPENIKLAYRKEILHYLMRNPVWNATIEYNDNRLSLYSAQMGKCAVTGAKLMIGDIFCHHKVPRCNGGTDAYQNLILLCGNAHRLIHATDTDTIARLTDSLNLTPKQKTKVDKLRSLVHVESC